MTITTQDIINTICNGKELEIHNLTYSRAEYLRKELSKRVKQLVIDYLELGISWKRPFIHIREHKSLQYWVIKIDWIDGRKKQMEVKMGDKQE